MPVLTAPTGVAISKASYHMYDDYRVLKKVQSAK